MTDLDWRAAAQEELVRAVREVGRVAGIEAPSEGEIRRGKWLLEVVAGLGD